MLRLRELRKRSPRKITLEELAEAIGSNAPTLSRIETGQQFPTAEQIKALSAFYGVQPHELFETFPQDDPGLDRVKDLLAGATPEQMERVVQLLELFLQKEAPRS